MKILAVSDLHFRRGWYEWLLGQIPAYDLVCLGGDLLEAVDPTAPTYEEQKADVTEWLHRAAALGVPLAWASGNHDHTRWTAEYPDLRFGSCWTDRLRGPGIAGDWETKVFGGAVVTALPFAFFYSTAFDLRCEKVLATGQRERLRTGLPWIVVAHEPPGGLSVSRMRDGDAGSGPLRYWVEKFQPSFVLSGHIHQAEGFHDRIGGTVCVNAGCDPQAAVPNHVVLTLGKKWSLRLVAEGRPLESPVAFPPAA